MKKFLLFLLLLYLALSLQFIITGWMDRAIFDFFFVLVIFWSYFRGWKEGLLAGFFCGLVKDIFFFSLVGVNAFSLSLIGFLVSEVEGMIYQQNVVFFTLIVAAAFLVNNLIVSIWLFLFYQFPFIHTFTSSFYPSLFYTCGLCSVIFLIGEKLARGSIPQS